MTEHIEKIRSSRSYGERLSPDGRLWFEWSGNRSSKFELPGRSERLFEGAFRQAAAFLNISLRKLDELQAGGDLRPVRIGRKRLFPREQLHGLLKRAATEPVG